MQIRLKRAYEAPGKYDGTRILVDRVWPRGVSRDDAKIDHWLKDIAPSKELRQWFGHDPDKWEEFEKRYFRELEQKSDAVQELQDIADGGRVTLVFAAKDDKHNNAVALKEYLQNH